GGIKNAKNFILKFLEPKIRLSECNNNNFYDYKSMLNEFAGKHSLAVRYEDALNDESALQKQKFEFIVYIDGEEMGKGAGGSKKEAQQMAAKVAYKKLITNK
ncbi:MAG: putative dsRNA-binding protein, partial [Clostridiales bacterium]|nr:putative dsRNA-binding protein [Clostridiales bacterium]